MSKPVTLQVTLLASRIFKLVGYEDGDAIPKKLVDLMYDLDMLYILTSYDQEATPESRNPEAVLDDLGILAKLTDEEKGMLVSYLESYSGPQEEYVEELRERLIGEDQKLKDQQGIDSDFSFESPPAGSIEIRSLFLSWAGEDIREEAEAALQLCEPFIWRSVRTFFRHDSLTDEPIFELGDKKIVYELEPVRNNRTLLIADERGNDRKQDYTITRVHRDNTVEKAKVSYNALLDHTERGGSGNYVMMSWDVDKITPPSEPPSLSASKTKPVSTTLTQEYLENPSEAPENPTLAAETDERTKENSDSRAKPSSPKEEGIHSSKKWMLFEIDEISNSGNPKIFVQQGMIVLTTVSLADPGEKVVVRWDGDMAGNQEVVEQAAPVDMVSNEQPISWLEENL